MSTTANAGSGIPLTALLGDAESLDGEEFGKRHGEAYLLLHGAKGSLVAGAVDQTLMVEKSRIEEAPPPQLNFLAFGLKAAEGESVSVGRAPSNDVTIDDESVSKLQCSIARTGDDSWELRDAGSQNGTVVNDKTAVGENAEPLVLGPGDRIRMGNVDLTFLPRWHLLIMLRRLA